MTVIKLPDKQTAALKAKAATEGLSLEAWLQKLAEQKRPARHRRITNVILVNMQDMPPEIMAHIPKDDASILQGQGNTVESASDTILSYNPRILQSPVHRQGT